jgi:hypothetical protein
VPHHPPHLIGLQAADEMPIERRQIDQLCLLGDGLLQATLAKAALAGSHRSPDGSCGLALAHRQQTATGRQLPPQLGEPCSQEIGGEAQMKVWSKSWRQRA